MGEPIHTYSLPSVDGAPSLTITWTRKDQAAARAEGWYLSAKGCAVRASKPEELSMPHLSAVAFVRSKARLGSERHIRALILDASAALREWEGRYRAAAGVRTRS